MRPSIAAFVVCLTALSARAITSCSFNLLSPLNANTVTKGWDLANGDFNGDGFRDVVAIHSQMNSYSILLGKGDGTFNPFTSFALTNPLAVAVGDFNGDHLDDLVIGYDTAANSVARIYLSNGDGTFTGSQVPITFPSFQNSRRIIAADFNKDGKLDVAIAGSPGVFIAQGFGNGNLAFMASYDLGSQSLLGEADDLAVGDFNKDGNLDLAAAEISHGVIPLMGNGNGTFVVKPALPAGTFPSSRPNAVAIGDVTGDGKADIITGLYGDNATFPVKVFPGNGDGTFGSVVDKNTINKVDHMAAADLDADGDLDLVLTGQSTVYVLLNDGVGNLSQYPVSVRGLPLGIAIADVDRDGGPDVLLTEFVNGKIITLLNKCGIASIDLQSSANPSNAGSDVTFTATTSSPAATPTGSLALAVDGVNVANGAVQTVSKTVSNPSLGAHTILASYSGDLRFYPSTKSITQTVQTPPFGAPPLLRAASVSPTSVTVTWIATSGVDHYEIQRGTAIGNLVTIGTSPTAGYSDPTVTGGNIYLYRVRGTSSTPGNPPSAYSSVDYATTVAFTDGSLVTGLSVMKAAHVTELRGVVDALRGAIALPLTPWTDVSLTGVTVKAVHLSELRTALDQVRSTIGLPALTYTDPALSGGVSVIRATHILELRDEVQ
jgi:hypothetical protein